MIINNVNVDLHMDDAFKALKKIPNGSIDAVVTDPPYAINIKDNHSETSDWDNMDTGTYKYFMANLFDEIERVLRPGGQAWVFYGITQIETVIDAFYMNDTDLRINWENALVYARNKGRGSSKKLKSLREEILHVSKGKPTIWNSVEYCRRVVVPYVKNGRPRGWALDISTGEPTRFTGLGNVAFFTAPSHNNKYEKAIHSCQKPILLNVAMIMMSTKEGDTVLDPFMGSGSCGVAAALCGRNFIGVEKEPEVFEKASKWINTVNYTNMADEYVKRRLSSSELTSKTFKFGQDSRLILPKARASV